MFGGLLVDYEVSRLVERLNEGWYDLATSAGLLDDHREFRSTPDTPTPQNHRAFRRLCAALPPRYDLNQAHHHGTQTGTPRQVLGAPRQGATDSFL